MLLEIGFALVILCKGDLRVCTLVVLLEILLRNEELSALLALVKFAALLGG